MAQGSYRAGPRSLGDLVADHPEGAPVEGICPGELLSARSPADLRSSFLESLATAPKEIILSAADPAQGQLPAAEFSYNGRPPSTFEDRWAAIQEVIERRFEINDAFSIVDLGSNHGYFSLQAARHFRRASVVGVEGSVGHGNGDIGNNLPCRLGQFSQPSAATEAAKLQEQYLTNVVSTSGVVTHLTWIAKLGLQNCMVAPEVWDLKHVVHLQQQGFCADVMLSLAVIHHMNRVGQEKDVSDRGKFAPENAGSTVPVYCKTSAPSEVGSMHVGSE
eukprot:TRINITY_DN32184_c0_g1_i1.p1 TRINITY_DN32184_c0_g1~~TRINITY_DN32184_c0_g1_i1.p1  ORF type:complete len:276 (+),score=37.10 TRINITY_DN32184_c0_g1_i1:107-934(+)